MARGYIEGLRPFLPRKLGPKRLTVAQAILELYPDGVPDQLTLPNKQLCAEVAQWLAEHGRPKLSETTIVRAAGRRKG
jgi:hypothetical protein